MLLSKLVCERTKEAPQDAKIKSHILLSRAGFIKQVAVGIYSMTTPCQKMSCKIQKIIREEMDALDGQEVLFPVVMPREIWELSDRYNTIGSEMVRFKDRNNRDMLLGMTHEEAAVHLANHIVSSYAQLPMMIYQIQTKFRDEARSRGGLIRVREFTMKDAYSFHESKEDLEKYYYRVYDAYYRIFKRIGLKNFIDIKSDSGMMGGSIAHEFMLLTEVGEDSIVLCNNCDYRANMEVAEGKINTPSVQEQPLELVFTGEDKTIDEVCARLKKSKEESCKAVVFAVKGNSEEVVIAFIRGDLEVNEAKLKKILGKEIVPYDGGVSEAVACGNIGPYELDKSIITVYDKSLERVDSLVIGANKAEYHYVGFNFSRDLPNAKFNDIAKVRGGDRCPVCGGKLRVENGIEIGNIFQLGTKYTKSMGMTVHGADGGEFNPIMGCYGIGVGRAIASVAQEASDDKGLSLPMSIAPWQVHICPLRLDDRNVNKKAYALYQKLTKAGVDVLFDDRSAAAGVKFNDADLMGMPIRIVVSPKSLATDEVEITVRKSGESNKVAYKDAVKSVKAIIKSQLDELNA
ncbi:MAG: proline--tRNA ligase [Clostridia bacterium]|nr:proline--tRNA ligase [Clostridia bacterium]MDE7329179.1 proline--tRNA ligase [Clostridia bacterium]